MFHVYLYDARCEAHLLDSFDRQRHARKEARLALCQTPDREIVGALVTTWDGTVVAYFSRYDVTRRP